MRIVKGSGNSRKVIEIVDSSIVRRSPENEQRAYAGQICDVLGIPRAA
jgi:hypothetical protein